MTQVATTTAVTNGNKASKVPTNNTNPLAGIGGLKPITTTHLSGKPLLKKSNAKAKEQEIVKEQDRIDTVKALLNNLTEEQKEVLESRSTKAKVKKAKSPLFTCSEAMGIIMKQNPKATAEVIINKADTLYIKKTGKESNIFQMGKYYHFAITFLKGYNAK